MQNRWRRTAGAMRLSRIFCWSTVLGVTLLGGAGLVYPGGVRAGDDPSANAGEPEPDPSGEQSGDVQIEDVDPEAEDGLDTLVGASGADPEMDALAESIEQFYQDLTTETLPAKAVRLYAPDARLEDPFGAAQGVDAIVAHHGKWLRGMKSLSLEMKEIFASGTEAVVIWNVTFVHSGITSAEADTLEGISHFRFAGGKVAYQRDHYDTAALIYERIPVIGFFVRWVKRRITGA